MLIQKIFRKIVRKSIVAKSEIKIGEKFCEKNIISKRPEGGISPLKWKKIIGKRSKYNFKGKNKLFIFMVATAMIPLPIIMIPLYVLVGRMGMNDTLLGLIIPKKLAPLP